MPVENQAVSVLAAHSGHHAGVIRVFPGFLVGNTGLLQIFLNKIHHFPLGSCGILAVNPDKPGNQVNQFSFPIFHHAD